NGYFLQFAVGEECDIRAIGRPERVGGPFCARKRAGVSRSDMLQEEHRYPRCFIWRNEDEHGAVGRKSHVADFAMHRNCKLIAMKCTVAAKYFVQHRSECKYVTARVGGLAADLLWRHVTRGSEHQSGRRVGTSQRSAISCGGHLRLFGQTKIQNLDPSIARHEDVFRLNIAMHNTFFL